MRKRKTRKAILKINRCKHFFFLKKEKINKPLARLTSTKREKTNTIKPKVVSL